MQDGERFFLAVCLRIFKTLKSLISELFFVANRPVRDLAFEHTGFTFLVTENALAQINSLHKKVFWSLATA